MSSREEVNKLSNEGQKADSNSFNEIRDQLREDDDYIINHLSLDVHITEDLKRAKYKYEVELIAKDNPNDHQWIYTIPTAKEIINDIAVSDNVGGLQYFLKKKNKKRTDLTFSFRNTLKKGEKYKFSYSYQTQIYSDINENIFSYFIAYSDWVVFDCYCEELIAKIHLPDNSKINNTLPPSINQRTDSNPILFEVDDLYSLSPFTFLTTFKSPRFTNQQKWAFGIFLTVVSIILAAFSL